MRTCIVDEDEGSDEGQSQGESSSHCYSRRWWWFGDGVSGGFAETMTAEPQRRARYLGADAKHLHT